MKETDGTVDDRTKELWSSVSGLAMHVTDKEQNGAESTQEVPPSVTCGAPRDLKQQELILRWGAHHRSRGMAKGPGL